MQCRHTGGSTNCLNLGSYNYLGFAENTGPCADAAHQSTLDYGAGTCSPARELGNKCSTEPYYTVLLTSLCFSEAIRLCFVYILLAAILHVVEEWCDLSRP